MLPRRCLAFDLCFLCGTGYFFFSPKPHHMPPVWPRANRDINCRLIETESYDVQQTNVTNCKRIMMTSIDGNIVRVTGLFWGESTRDRDRWPQRPVTQNFDFFYLRLNKRLSKQSSRRWVETPWPPLWRDCNVQLCWRLFISTLNCND